MKTKILVSILNEKKETLGNIELVQYILSHAFDEPPANFRELAMLITDMLLYVPSSNSDQT